MDLNEYMEWIIPFLLLSSGIIIGIAFEKIILYRLRIFAQKTNWLGTESVIKAIYGLPFFWSSMAGAFFALEYLKFSKKSLQLLHHILILGLIFTVTLAIVRLSDGLIKLYAQRTKGILAASSIFTNISMLLIWTIGFLAALQYLGIPITPMLTALGVGGIAVAMALQPTLSSLFSGLSILASPLINPGDYIKLDSGDEGFVHDVTWRNTVIRTMTNNLIIVPNANIVAIKIINHNLPNKELAVLLEVGVSYASDLKLVEQVTIATAREIQQQRPEAVTDFEPYIRFHTFADSSINFTVIMRAREFIGQFPIKHEFIKKLHVEYAKAGIVIPYPIRTVIMQK